MPTSDEILLARYKQGNAHAFRELVERYSSSLYNLAYRLLRDPMEAENVVQETFLRVITSVERVRLDLPFKPYLYRIAVNYCYDLLRAKKEYVIGDLESVGELAEDAPEILERIEKEELQSRLRQAIEILPPQYRTVIVLRYVDEFSYEEIAQVLNLPLNTVRTHLHRAKERLKTSLAESESQVTVRKDKFVLRTAEGS